MWKHWDASGTWPEGYIAAGAGSWEETSLAGISVKKLHVDAEQDRVTMLVRMAPGTSYPAHRHGGAEECYVLEGDLRVSDSLHMHANDFQRVEAGSVHREQSTDDGCLLLIVSSLSDELLEAQSLGGS